MTTIINPSGTPTVVYNRSGKTIAPITGGMASAPGGVGNDGTPIVSYSERTIVVVSCAGSDYVVTLPSSASVGDEVSITADPSSTTMPTVFPPVGESVWQFPVSTGTNGAAGYGMGSLLYGLTFIKVSSTNWQPF